MVAKDRALLVLPAGCDVGGRPTVVTLSSADAEEAPRILADMLVDLANTAMRTAGCAPGEPLARTSPIDGLHRRDFTSPPDRACGIPGVHFSDSPATSNDQYASVHGDRYQTCSVVRTSPRRPAEPVGHYVMVGTPRLVALFEGLPEGPARGLVRRSCDGRPTLFYGDPQKAAGTGVPDDGAVFARYVESVGKRVGCGDGGEA
ncbi:hypothetical protein [Streptomyces sudanensis]|uniref:hypothetical protein n=1 Tax=Streptomyces sudanensis TaxID=436397 RepID=UPI0020CC6FA0|nr:hypothetical protein [Streptomyces sudanensis]MCP9959177.1 hypothetical protein [Streptomyces sudanensis]